ncbi:hypothetical protein EGW08_007775, partial [Elysia chlorotica]
AVVWTSSRLLAKSHQTSWKELSPRDRRRAATSLVTQLEKTGFELADSLAVGQSSVTLDRNVVVKATRLDTQTHQTDLTFPAHDDLDLQAPWQGNGNSITISSTSLKSAGHTGPLSVVFMMYNNLEDLMEPQQNEASPTSSTDDSQPVYDTDIISGNSVSSRGAGSDAAGGGTDDKTVPATPELVVNSRIISASMGSSRLRRLLPEPVRFTLKHL